jgi:hypothetical protein
MSELDSEKFVSDEADKLFGIFGLSPDTAAILHSSDIRERRFQLRNWFAKLQEKIIDMTISEVKDAYLIAKSKIEKQEIQKLEVMFNSDMTKEDDIEEELSKDDDPTSWKPEHSYFELVDGNEYIPVQDRHPLLRAIELASHVKRSIWACSEKDVGYAYQYSNSHRIKEIDGADYSSHPERNVSHIFLDIERYGILPMSHADFESVLQASIKFEEYIDFFHMDAESLAKKPEQLREAFEYYIEQAEDEGGNIVFNVAQLMLWEVKADSAIVNLEIYELEDLYNHYMNKQEQDEIDHIIVREINSVCMELDELTSHLNIVNISEIPGVNTGYDQKIAHLVSDIGPYPVNLKEALGKVGEELFLPLPQVKPPHAHRIPKLNM